MAQAKEEDKAYEPKDAIQESVRLSTLFAAAGLAASAIQTALTRQIVGGMPVFTRTGGIIGIMGTALVKQLSHGMMLTPVQLRQGQHMVSQRAQPRILEKRMITITWQLEASSLVLCQALQVRFLASFLSYGVFDMYLSEELPRHIWNWIHGGGHTGCFKLYWRHFLWSWRPNRS